MTEAPRLSKDSSRTTKVQTSKTQSSLSGPMLIFMTALDTTWRAFIPTLGGVFLGIGLDSLVGIAPVATIICLIIGTVLSILLIAKQLRDVRRPLR